MAKLYGWTGKILRVNLTNGKISDVDTSAYVPQFIGGAGICTKIVWDEVPAATKAFDEANKVVFMTGPMGGTLAPAASRTHIGFKSPLTYPGEYFVRSNFGGHWGAELKFAGYDGIIIEGKSTKPVYLWISDGKTEIRDAASYWGKGVYATETAIWKDIGSMDAKIAAIGPAGENLVRFAAIGTDNGNFAGFSGAGAVLGSKNLKAIAVKGTGAVDVARLNELSDYALYIRKLLRRGEAKPPFGIERLSLHRTGQGLYSNEAAISFLQETTSKASGCYGCPTGCYSIYKTPGGVKGTEAQICAAYYWYVPWDYQAHGKETIVSAKVCGLIDDLGLSAMEATHILIWLQSCYMDGSLSKEKTGLSFDDIGEYEFAERYLNMMAYKQGFGDTLAQGLVRASDATGVGRQYFRIMNSMADTYFANMYSPSMYPVSALLGATDVSTRLAKYHTWAREIIYKHKDHTDGAGWVNIDEWVGGLEDIFGRTDFLDHTDDAFYSPNKAWLAKWLEDFKTATDEGMEICDYFTPNFWSWYSDAPYRRGYSPQGEAKLFSLTTGIDWDVKTMLQAGERIRNLQRAIAVTEGRNRSSDVLDDQYFTVTLEDWPNVPTADGTLVKQTRVLDKAKFETLKDAFYTERGWDLKTGIPTRAKLEELGMADVADKLGV